MTGRMAWGAMLLAGMLLPAAAAMAQPAPPRQTRAVQAQQSGMPAGSVPMTLPEAVFLALRHNRSIRSQYLQRVADRFNLRVAEASFDPRFGVQGNSTYARTGRTTGIATTIGPVVNIATPIGTQFQFGWLGTQTNNRGANPLATSRATFTVVQPLLAGGGTDFAMAPLRIARIQEVGSRLQLRSLVADQVTQTITAYRALIQAQEQLRIAGESLRRARDLAGVNQALVAAGRLAQVELIQAETSIAQQELQLASAENSWRQARLALLTVLAVDQSAPVWAVERPAAESARVDPRAALEVALANQPDYLRTLLGVEVARITLDVARNQRLWEVNVVAGNALGAQRADVFRSVEALTGARSDFNVGLQVNIPLGQVAREQPEVNAAIALRQTELQIATARDRLRQQVEDTVRAIDTLKRQAELARRARELAATQLELELVKLQAGRSSNFQVVSFQGALQSAESAELSAVVAYANALSQLDQILGTTLDTWQISVND